MKEEWDLDAFKNYNPLHLMINKSRAAAPSILMIRDLDSIGKGNDKLLDILANEIKRVPDMEKVCIVGLARQLQKLPEQLKKVDVFRQHMAFSIPTMNQRKEILRSMLLGMNLAPMNISSDIVDDYTTHISLRTSGFVARDLKLLCRYAGLKSRRSSNIKANKKNTTDEDTLTEHLKQLHLTGTGGKKLVHWSDFEYALENYQPSQQLEVESTLPKREWQEIGGYDKIKQRIRQSTLVPLLQQEIFKRLGISPPSGLLLYGPSGCGKTMMVQALASESMMNVISINGPGIFSKYLGETENKIRRLFATAKKIAPCLVFIDELDAIGSRRGWDSGGDSNGGVNERVLSTLLNEMDGVEGRNGVIVIGCTNRPQQIDDAILRPGRLDQLIYVDMPTIDDRKDIITRLCKRMRVDNDIDALELAKETAYCTGADLDYLFREAGTVALRQDIDTLSIGKRHLDQVLNSITMRTKDRVDGGILDCYKKFQNEHSV
ncbi:P-loop containing nucleoside triphosphate hydrolase protein [Chlamydoabsidia padenii]|nr:P-loop containing nucleoside triphosphate hydrolase protein [Chlamydoabsidia padenii]